MLYVAAALQIQNRTSTLLASVAGSSTAPAGDVLVSSVTSSRLGYAGDAAYAGGFDMSILKLSLFFYGCINKSYKTLNKLKTDLKTSLLTVRLVPFK